MSENDTYLEETESPDWKMKALVIGGVVGAAVGLLGAYMLIQNTDKAEVEPGITTREGVKLGVLVMGLLRQISTLNER